MMMIKQLGGWRSDTVASGYIADSMKSKDLIYQGITHENKNTIDSSLAQPSTSKENSCQFISSNNNVEQNNQISELQLTYEDFCDDFYDSLEPIQQEAIQLPVNFITANQKVLPPVPLKDNNEKHSFVNCLLQNHRSNFLLLN